MDEEKGISILKETKNILDKYKVEFWLDGGTLLGLYRDRHFIQWDHDIDLDCWKVERDWDKIGEEFKKKGYSVVVTDDSFEIKRDNIVLDLEFKEATGDEIIMEFRLPNRSVGRISDYIVWVLKARDPVFKVGKTDIETVKKHISLCKNVPFKNILIFIFHSFFKVDSTFIRSVTPVHFFKNLKDFKIFGIKVKIPKETEEYLCYHYGSDWRKPIRDPGNVAGSWVVRKKKLEG